MLQDVDLSRFGLLPAHLMLLAMCASLEEGQGSDRTAGMLGRIPAQSLIDYLKRRLDAQRRRFIARMQTALELKRLPDAAETSAARRLDASTSAQPDFKGLYVNEIDEDRDESTCSVS